MPDATYRDLPHPVREALRIAEKIVRPLAPETALKIGYLSRIGRWPEIGNPLFYTEYLARRTIRLDEPLVELFADKLATRHWAADRLGTDLMPLLLAALSDEDAILSFRHDRPVVAKPNHLSGEIEYLEFVDASAAERLAGLQRRWKAKSLAKRRGERWYRSARPLLLIEEDIRIDKSRPADDLKAFCFGGEVLFVNHMTGRFDEERITSYDRDWKPVGIDFGYPPSAPVEPPRCLPALIEAARILSRPLPFVRADFYDIDGRLYLGELTPVPQGGRLRMKTSANDLALGGAWAAALGIEPQPSQRRAAREAGIDLDQCFVTRSGHDA